MYQVLAEGMISYIKTFWQENKEQYSEIGELVEG